MLFDKANAGELRPWLVQTLEPICDADPEVLTDYVLALMQHDASEDQLQKMFVEQLHDFLEQEAAPFVDKLFQALRTKSYLTPAEGVKPTPTASKSPSPPSQPQVQTSSTSDDIAIPIPSSSQSNHLYASPIPTEPRGRKRNLDNDDEYQLNVRPKGPRIGDDHASRYGNGRGSMNAERSTPSSRGGMIGQNGRSKGICYNYHNHGYCARGALCPYSHGDDPITANPMPFQHQQQPGQPGPVPFPPPILGMIPPNMLSMLMQGQGGGYDPMQAHMDLSNGGRRSGGGFRRNQDRDEDSVMIDVTPNQVPQPIIKPLDGSSMNQAGAMDGVVMANHVPIQNGPLANQGGSINGHVTPPFSGRGRGMSRRGGHGRGGPPERGGTFNGDHSNFPPIDPSTNGPGQGRTDKTLVVERIPAEKLNLAAVNDYFKNFGTVTNVAIDAKSSKALVSFETHEQAYAAWKSEDAVLGNRFVKLFWHRPMEGQGGTGTKLLAASAPLMKNLAAQASQSTSTPPSSSIPSASLAKQPAKLSLLQLQINEQKSLLAKVATATPEEKKVIMARLRKLDEEMKAPTSATAGNGFTSTRNGVDSAMSEKERLDKELAEMQGDSEMTDATSNENSGGNESLQAKVARLRAEVNITSMSYLLSNHGRFLYPART
ncbi:hypothetical protein FRC02_005665 [Tulasnella sp. 418]|nr:hypothetical protein FRC02_005665 [Tulasnella sp. 418]